MARILIVYATTEGQTAKIARHIAAALEDLGHAVTVTLADEAPGLETGTWDAVIVGASLHEGRFQRAAQGFVRAHRAALAALPGAFFGVSLGAASDDSAERVEVERLIAGFGQAAGWQPARTASFAGALRYTRYSWLKRALMRHIAAREGGPTDTQRDYEFTDWDAVTRFAEACARMLP